MSKKAKAIIWVISAFLVLSIIVNGFVFYSINDRLTYLELRTGKISKDVSSSSYQNDMSDLQGRVVALEMAHYQLINFLGVTNFPDLSGGNPHILKPQPGR